MDDSEAYLKCSSYALIYAHCSILSLLLKQYCLTGISHKTLSVLQPCEILGWCSVLQECRVSLKALGCGIFQIFNVINILSNTTFYNQTKQWAKLFISYSIELECSRENKTQWQVMNSDFLALKVKFCWSKK